MGVPVHPIRVPESALINVSSIIRRCAAHGYRRRLGSVRVYNGYLSQD